MARPCAWSRPRPSSCFCAALSVTPASFFCPEPGREPTSTAATLCVGGSRLPHSLCVDPQPTVRLGKHQLGHIHTHRALCRCWEHSPAGTSLALCTIHCAGPQEEQSPLLLGLSCQQGARLAGSGLAAPCPTTQPLPAPHLCRNPQTAAAHAGGQPSIASPVQQALRFPAQISVWRVPPRAALAATRTCSSKGGLALTRHPGQRRRARGWGRTCHSRTELHASSWPPPPAPEHPRSQRGTRHRCRAMPHEAARCPAILPGLSTCRGPSPGRPAMHRGRRWQDGKDSVPLSVEATWSPTRGHRHVRQGDRDPTASRGEGTKRLPALAATEGQRKAWKLEAQSSLTVPMLRRPVQDTASSDGAGESRQRTGGCCVAEQQAPRCWDPRAGCRQGSRRSPHSGWSRGRRLWQGSSSCRSPRASPSQSSPLPACTPACSAPDAPAGSSKPLRGRGVWELPGSPPAPGRLPP